MRRSIPRLRAQHPPASKAVRRRSRRRRASPGRSRCARRRRRAEPTAAARPGRSAVSRARKASTTSSRLLGLERARGVDELPARPHQAGQALEHRALTLGVARRRLQASSRQRMSGLRASVPRPLHGASSSTPSNAPRNGGAQRVGRDRPTARSRPSARRAARAPRAGAARPPRPRSGRASAAASAISERLAAGSGAGVEPEAADVRQPGDELRARVLDVDDTLLGQAAREVALEPVARSGMSVGWRVDAGRRESLGRVGSHAG